MSLHHNYFYFLYYVRSGRIKVGYTNLTPPELIFRCRHLFPAVRIRIFSMHTEASLVKRQFDFYFRYSHLSDEFYGVSYEEVMWWCINYQRLERSLSNRGGKLLYYLCRFGIFIDTTFKNKAILFSDNIHSSVEITLPAGYWPELQFFISNWFGPK